MRKQLILGQAFLLLVILLFALFLFFQVKGNPFLYGKAKKALEDYYNSYYADLDLVKKELSYQKEDKSYTITYEDKEEELLNFTLVYQDGKVSSNYQENYVEGKELLEERAKVIQDEAEKISQNTIYEVDSIVFDSFDLYSKSEQEEIKKGDDLKGSSLYQLNLTVMNMNLSPPFISELSSFLSENGFEPKTIGLTLKNSQEESKILLEKGDDEEWTIVPSAKS